MTTFAMIIFIVYILVWVLCGLLMILNMDNFNMKVNWFGIAFFVLAPLIPVVAKICSIL